MEFIENKEELPNFSDIVIEIQGDTLLGGGKEGDIIGLKLSGESCCLVSTSHFRINQFNDYLMVKKRLEMAGYSEVREVSAPVDVVDLLLSNHSELIKNAADGYSDAEQEFFKLVGRAVSLKASDIHIFRRENIAELAFRIHGDYTPQGAWTTTKSDEIIQVAYGVLGMNKEQTWDRKRPQDTDIKIMLNGKPVKLRYSHYPADDLDSWHAVFRVIVQDEDGALTPKQLGYSEEQVKQLGRMLMKPEGLILLVGETGSGKSTTITSILTQYLEAMDYKLSVQSLEDPPEYKVKGVVQSPVIRVKDKNDAPDVNFFAKGIRSCMRRDPDILNLGEIRDGETAKAIISAVQSGHRVVSTLHAPSALAAIERLEDLGVPRNVMASSTFFTGIVYQALIQELCPDIKETIEFTDDEGKFGREFKEMIDANEDLSGKSLYTRGTSLKNPTGICGRTVAAEIVVPDKIMLKMIKNGQDIELEEYWREQGAQTNYQLGVGFRAKDHAIKKVAAGDCCPFDVFKKMGRFDE